MVKILMRIMVLAQLLLFTGTVDGQAKDEWPTEDRTYLYIASNVLNLKHTASGGFWNPKHEFGVNATASYYADITIPGWIHSSDTSEFSDPGPAFVSLSVTARFKPDADLNTFAGLGFSVNKLIHGKYPEVDNAFEWSAYMACPRSKFVQYDLPYSTFLIENGYNVTSKGRPFFVSFIAAWHPIEIEYFDNKNWFDAKGYFTPMNIQLRIEFGIKSS